MDLFDRKSTVFAVCSFLDRKSIVSCEAVCKSWNRVFTDFETSNAIWLEVLLRERYSLDSTLIDSVGNSYVPDFKQLYSYMVRMRRNLHRGETHVREHIGVTQFLRDMHKRSSLKKNTKIDLDSITGRVYCANDTIIYFERKKRGEDAAIVMYDMRRQRVRRVIRPLRDLKRVYPNLDVSNASVLFSELRGALSTYYVQIAFPFDPFTGGFGPENPPPAPLCRGDEDAVPEEFRNLGRVTEPRVPLKRAPDSLVPCIVRPGGICSLNIPPLLPEEVPIIRDMCKIQGAPDQIVDADGSHDGYLNPKQKEALALVRNRKGTAWTPKFLQIRRKVVPKWHILDLARPMSSWPVSPYRYKGRGKTNVAEAEKLGAQPLKENFLMGSPYALGSEVHFMVEPPPNDYMYTKGFYLPLTKEQGYFINMENLHQFVRAPSSLPPKSQQMVRSSFDLYCWPRTYASEQPTFREMLVAIIKKREEMHAAAQKMINDELRPCSILPLDGYRHQAEVFGLGYASLLTSMGKGCMVNIIGGEYSPFQILNAEEDLKNRLKDERNALKQYKDGKAIRERKKAAGEPLTKEEAEIDALSAAGTPEPNSEFDWSEVEVDLQHRIGVPDSFEAPLQPGDEEDEDFEMMKSCKSHLSFTHEEDHALTEEGQIAKSEDVPPPEQPVAPAPPASATGGKKKRQKTKWELAGACDGSEEGLPIQAHRMLLFYDVTNGDLLWHAPFKAMSTGLSYLNEQNHLCHRCGRDEARGVSVCVSPAPENRICFHNMWSGEQISAVNLLPPLAKDAKSLLNFSISKDEAGLVLVTFPVYTKWKCQRSVLEVFDLQQVYAASGVAAARRKHLCAAEGIDSAPVKSAAEPSDIEALANFNRAGFIVIDDPWQVREVCLSLTRIFVLTALDVLCFDTARFRGQQMDTPPKSDTQANKNDPYDPALLPATKPIWRMSSLVGKRAMRAGYLDFSHYGHGMLAITTLQGLPAGIQLAWVGEDCTCTYCLPPHPGDSEDRIPCRTPVEQCVNRGRKAPWHEVCDDAIVELIVPEIAVCNDPEMMVGVVWFAAGGRFVVADFCRGGYLVFSTQTLDLVYRCAQPAPERHVLDEVLRDCKGTFPEVRGLPRPLSRTLPINDHQVLKIFQNGFTEIHDFAKDPVDEPHLRYLPRPGLFQGELADPAGRGGQTGPDETVLSADYKFDPLSSKWQDCLWGQRRDQRPFGMPDRPLVYRRRVRVIDGLKGELGDDHEPDIITSEEVIATDAAQQQQQQQQQQEEQEQQEPATPAAEDDGEWEDWDAEDDFDGDEDGDEDEDMDGGDAPEDDAVDEQFAQAAAGITPQQQQILMQLLGGSMDPQMMQQLMATGGLGNFLQVFSGFGGLGGAFGFGGLGGSADEEEGEDDQDYMNLAPSFWNL